ncbi:MAG: hypothetical protein AB7I36_19095 [Rhodospirillaceae bacterium]
MLTQKGSCPICARHDQFIALTAGPGGKQVICKTCGTFVISGSLYADQRRNDPKVRALLSHHVARLARASGEPPTITTYILDGLIEAGRIPMPAEQGDNLIVLLGENHEEADPGEYRTFDKLALAALIGGRSKKEAVYVADELKAQGLLDVREHRPLDEEIKLRLTFNGWAKARALVQGGVYSRRAFMAMKFDDGSTAAAYAAFRAATAQTGFDLRHLDDGAPAGNIDLRMQVEIARARFIIADLTFQNLGVYWEAGVAEGMRKPVIYTCRADHFEQVHFDTKHYKIMKWSPAELGKARSELKTIIRATLPTEAVLDDKEQIQSE